MSVAAARNSAPPRRENAKTAKAIANAAAAWSLGKDGSLLFAESRCVRAGWVVKGRGRSQRWATTWLASSATAAATRAETDASFQRGLPYGRARNQRPTVASA
jgi:hypothetical protein